MNSFESDLKRALINFKFFIGIFAQTFILVKYGIEAEQYSMCLPVTVALPYSTAWINEYRNGFIKEYLPRCGVMSYIAGKFLACVLSGGLMCVVSCKVAQIMQKDFMYEQYKLLFCCGMLWAGVASVMAAVSNSKYIAYGGSFVIFYILVILYERYFKGLYCLYPIEWYFPMHTWVFGEAGIILMCVGSLAVLWLVYYEVLRRHINHA